MPRRQERSANLVWEKDCYRIVSDFEMTILQARKAVVHEKTRADKGLYVHFYRRV